MVMFVREAPDQPYRAESNDVDAIEALGEEYLTLDAAADALTQRSLPYSPSSTACAAGSSAAIRAAPTGSSRADASICIPHANGCAQRERSLGFR